MVRVGVLGAGFMGSTHARALAGLDNVEIVGIYGQSEKRAQPLAEELGTSWTTDLEKLIDDPSVDGIDICLPGPQHREVTELAIKAGKQSSADFEYSGWLTEANHLGNVAYRVGKKLEWDPVKMKATNAPEADQYIKRKYRKGWEL